MGARKVDTAKRLVSTIRFPSRRSSAISKKRPSTGISRRPQMKILPSCCISISRTLALALAVSLASSVSTFADDPWKPWIEPDFPFFSSALDLRPQSPDAKEWNITPRGIVLNLGHDCWACFDTDLLRVSAIWTGKGVTEDSLAPLSYQNKPLKTVGGQSKLAKPDGRVWLLNGI